MAAAVAVCDRMTIAIYLLLTVAGLVACNLYLLYNPQHGNAVLKNLVVVSRQAKQGTVFEVSVEERGSWGGKLRLAGRAAAAAATAAGAAGADGEPLYYNSSLLGGMLIPQPWDPFNLTEIIRDNLEPDIRRWQRVYKAKARLRDVIDMAKNDSVLCKGLTNVRRLVEIKDGRLRFPMMPKGELQTSCQPDVQYCDPSMQPWAEQLMNYARRFKLELPNMVFFLGVFDDAACTEQLVAQGVCKAPVFNTGKEDALHVDLMMPPLTPAFTPVIYRALPWASKSDKAFFRGVGSCTSGILGFRGKGWCSRSVVARMAHTKHSDVLDAGLTEPYNSEHEIKADPTLRDGNGALPVVGYVSIDELPAYKYLLNLDGHVAAWRLGMLLAVNSLVLRQESPFVEWFYRSLKPYTHYVPIFNYSMTDLIPQLNWAKAHEAEVQQIIEKANAFAMRYTTLHARMVYIKYALLAYKQLFADLDTWFDPDGPGAEYAEV